MKWTLCSLACLLVFLTAVKSEAATVAPRQKNPQLAVRKNQASRPPVTVWERMRDPRGAWQNRLARPKSPGASPRSRALASGAHPLSGAITNPIFFIPPTYSSGGRLTRNVASGDFNGDGMVDLLVTNQCVSDADCSQGTVAVLLQNSDGTYKPALVSPTGAVLSSVTVGDFNRDGKLDLAVDNSCPDIGCTGGSLNVLLGNGNGTFQPPVPYSTGGNAFSVEAGDVNGDGKLDLIAGTGGSSAAVLLGNGDGTFQAAANVTTSSSGNSAVFLGDFNGDNQLDLAVVTSDCDATGTCTRSVSVLPGNGDGTFAAPVGNQSAVGLNPQAVGLGDINGDGKLDLAVVDACVPSTDTCVNESVEAFLGKGNGAFETARSSASISTDVTSIGFADLDDDGKLDLGAVDPDAGQENIMLGAGDGTFQVFGVYETEGVSPLFSSFGDLNADGKSDLLVANVCTDSDCLTGSVVALFGNGNGTFQAPVGYPAPFNSALQSLAVADFNGDGRPDLAESIANFTSSSASLSVTVLLGQTDGTFVPGPTSVVGTDAFNPSFPTDLVAGDFNQDGKSDLATMACPDQACTSLQLVVLLGKGDGTFQPPVFLTPLPSFSLAAGDFNGDGKLDLASVTTTCGSDPFVCNDGHMNILLGNGDGTFQAPVTYPFVGDHPGSVTAADLNRDGNLDVVVANGNCGEFACPMGSLSVFLGNGDGTFQTAVNYPSGDFGARSVATGDFNQDGKVDLAVSNVGSCDLLPCGSSSIGVLLGNGDGSFQPATVVAPGPPGDTGDVRSIVAADLDGDGNLDLALSTRRVLLGNGDGAFKDPQSYNPSRKAAVSAVIADFNGDGKPDLVVNASQYVIALLNISTSFQHATSTSLASSLNPSNLHRRVTFTATVTSSSAGKITGTITFSDRGHALASVPMANGKARFSTSSLAAGTHRITASYGGNETFQPSTSPALKQVVREETRVKLTSSKNPSHRGQPVTFTAAVKTQSGETPTGTVTFKDFCTLLATVALSGGQATFTTSHLHKGLHVIRADYHGSSTDRPSSAVLGQTVK